LEFFQYYANFDFANAGISIIEGSSVTKPDPEVPLYIENPLERELNVAKNVQSVYVQEFQTACQSASRCLEQSSTPASSKPWGLLNILQVTESNTTTDAAQSEGSDGWTSENSDTVNVDANGSVSNGHKQTQARLNIRVEEIFDESDPSDHESVLRKSR
jgi:Cid1 family poly A polymerase